MKLRFKHTDLIRLASVQTRLCHVPVLSSDTEPGGIDGVPCQHLSEALLRYRPHVSPTAVARCRTRTLSPGYRIHCKSSALTVAS